jgi:diguanylate cyclase (GGDEF)-like protein
MVRNPDYEVDSFLLTFMVCSIGITYIACRRYLELRQATAERDVAQRLAFFDPLTGLENRRALTQRLEALFDPDVASQVALIIVDLDKFKTVNDVHGHLAGDRLLRLATDRLIEISMEGQTVFRLGGDEFAVLVDLRKAGTAAPEAIARHIVLRMAQPFVDGGLVHHIGASVGIACFPGDAGDGDGLLRAADVALYRAKHDGRGQLRCYEEAMDDQIKQRDQLERQLREAIGLGKIKPYYQPMVDLRSGGVIGFELLARWPQVDGSEIEPHQFIPIAEECGLIGELLLDLLDRVCVETRDWDPELTIAINISTVQLKDPWLAEKILATLSRHGFAPQRIAIEITENAIIADEGNARRMVESLKNQGIKIGLDDFGTGFSSLHHLRILPFDMIKIDKSFVAQIDQKPESLKIVKAIVGLATCLDLPVVAEGIETFEVAQIMRDLGCAQGQGYLFGRALPAEDAIRLSRPFALPDVSRPARSRKPSPRQGNG